MSHLLQAFTLGTQWKHQYDIYFGKIHWVVHEILSVLYFRYFSNERGSHFWKSDINLNQLHLQITLIDRDYIQFSISWDIGI